MLYRVYLDKAFFLRSHSRKYNSCNGNLTQCSVNIKKASKSFWDSGIFRRTGNPWAFLFWAWKEEWSSPGRKQKMAGHASQSWGQALEAWSTPTQQWWNAFQPWVLVTCIHITSSADSLGSQARKARAVYPHFCNPWGPNREPSRPPWMLPEEAEMTVRGCVEPCPRHLLRDEVHKGREGLWDRSYRCKGACLDGAAGDTEAERASVPGACCPLLWTQPGSVKDEGSAHSVGPPRFCSQLGRAVVLHGPCLHSFILL